MGAASLHVRAPEIRRLFLRDSRYFIYYSVHGAEVEVLRVWHASRGTEPKL